MPNYEYSCPSCGYKGEIFQRIVDDPLKKCPECGKETLKRGPGGGIGLSFKGNGFYKTDYASPSEPKSSGSGCCPCGKNKGSCKSE